LIPQAQEVRGVMSRYLPGSNLPVVLHHFCGPIYPDSPWLPRIDRLHVIDCEGHEPVAFSYIEIFSGSIEDLLAVTSYPEVLVIEFKSDGHDVGLTLAGNCRNPRKALRLQMLYLGVREQLDSWASKSSSEPLWAKVVLRYINDTKVAQSNGQLTRFRQRVPAVSASPTLTES
jgi:hypothetical protein